MQTCPENTVRVDGAWVTWPELVSGMPRIFPGLGGEGAAAFAVRTSRGAMTAAALLGSRSYSGAVLVESHAGGPAVAELGRRGYPVVHEGAQARIPEAPKNPEHAILVFTSGTTGAPKIVEHTWRTLWTYDPPSPEPYTWMVPFLPGTYAWYQLVTLGLFVPGQRLVPGWVEAPAEALELAASAGVDAVSATPTFWRVALLTGSPDLLRSLALRQITLGGEPVDQAILTRLTGLFPNARVTHIYATTETGPAVVVHDGLAGFPAEWLDGADHGCGARLRSLDGCLQVLPARRHRSACAAEESWVDTGDLLEVAGGRAFVAGRSGGQVINIGGSKVSARQVREVLLAHSAVAWCRIAGTPAPLVGSLVAADLVLSERIEGVALSRMEELLDAHCRERLPAEAVPRVWRFLDEIPVTGGVKSEEARNAG